MSLSIRQHWIPRFYLRYFATPNCRNSRVWVLHRKEGGPQLVNIEKIAVKKHLYSQLREAQLADLEGDLSRLWPQLANDYVDLESRAIRQVISLFLSTLFLRNPQTFALQRESRRKMIDCISRAPKDGNGLPDIESLMIGGDRISFDKHRWKSFVEAGPKDEHQSFVHMIRAEAVHIAEGLMKKRWSVVVMDEPLFVTSDNPFFQLHPNMKRHQILGKAAMLMFPLSPTRILWLDDLDASRSQYHKVAADQAGHYNGLTWVNTDNFMISPRSIEDVIREICAARKVG